jgi:hypothetical protein
LFYTLQHRLCEAYLSDVTAGAAVVVHVLAVAVHVMPDIFLEMLPLWLQFCTLLCELSLAFCILLLSKIKHIV